MFALGNYRAATMEAHAILSLGGRSDWATIAGFYGNPADYTPQLRALEKYVNEHPTEPGSRFLLGYEYLTIGSRADAISQFAQASSLAPKDKLATQVLRQLQGAAAPPTTAVRPSPTNR